jgi:CheY-like chemotaxis protein
LASEYSPVWSIVGRRGPAATDHAAEKERSMGYVLLAEDSPEYTKQILNLLSPLGLNIVCARDGREAVERLADTSYSIDLLVTDLDMPYQTGWDVIDAARRIHGDLIPIIMQTGEADYPRVQMKAGELGIVLIDKEALRYELLPAVSRAVDPLLSAGG